MAVPQLVKTSSGTLVSVVRALAHLGGSADEWAILKWVGCSHPTVKNGSRILELCGLVTVADGAVSLIDTLPRHLSDEAATAAIFNAISHSDAFVELASLIAGGDVEDEATRRAAMVEPTLGHQESARILLAVALDFGLLERGAHGGLAVAERLASPAVQLIEPDEMQGSAQLVLRDLMGAPAYRGLYRVERERLGEAIRDIEANPGKACEDAGKAAENYLRIIAADAGADVSTCNGLGQVADVLAGKQVAIIRPQHRVAAHQLAMARNASGHDRDKETLVGWEKTPAFARATVILSARFIASVHEWVESRYQVL